MMYYYSAIKETTISTAIGVLILNKSQRHHIGLRGMRGEASLEELHAIWFHFVIIQRYLLSKVSSKLVISE